MALLLAQLSEDDGICPFRRGKCWSIELSYGTGPWESENEQEDARAAWTATNTTSMISTGGTMTTRPAPGHPEASRPRQAHARHLHAASHLIRAASLSRWHVFSDEKTRQRNRARAAGSTRSRGDGKGGLVTGMPAPDTGSTGAR